jgi:glycine cleavage system H protein
VSGKIVEVNEALKESPEMINQDPYGEGWMVLLELEDRSEVEELLTAERYREYLKTLEK